MIIKKIKLKNIRSYENVEIIFSEGSTLLAGDIGTGKTSILMAIEFALFGLQPGQRGSSLLRNGENEGGAMIEFEIDGKKIIVERTLKKSKAISQDYCSITIDEEKKEIAVTELKSQILELLNYPKEFSKKQNILYKFTVYTPQEEMKQIILQDPETRINTLRHVFGIDKYKKILENISIINTKIREEKRTKEGATMNLEQDRMNLISKESNIETKKEGLDILERDRIVKRDIRKRIEEEKEEIMKKIEEKIKLQQEVEKTRIIVSNKNENILNNEKLINQIQSQLDELLNLQFDEEKIQILENKIIENKKEKAILHQKNIVVSSEINSIKTKNEDNEKLEKKISSLEVCPTCLQEVDAIYRANVLNKTRNEISINKTHLSELETTIREINQKEREIDGEINKFEREITDLKILKMKLSDLNEKKTRILEIKNNNLKLLEDVELLKNHNEILNKSIFELGKYGGIFEEKKRELDEAIRQERYAEIKFAEVKKEIEVFSSQILELKMRIKKTEEIRKELEYLSNLEDWLNKKFIPIISFIEKNVMIKLKTEFSNLFSEWFSILVTDSFNVRLDDKFTPIIEQRDYEIDYTYLSGGERTAIALAYRLALNQVINSILSKIKTKDLVILDEPTDGFSDQQLDKMREVLEQLNIKQLIIVSHEQKIEGFVENIIRLKKLNGKSEQIS